MDALRVLSEEVLLDPANSFSFSRKSALGFHDFTATQAGRADADALSLAIYLGVNRTQIDVPAPLGHVVGVADVVSRLRLLAANITLLCHWTAPR